MAKLTLQSGPGLLHSESLRDDGHEKDTSVTFQAHEYLFEELDRFGRPSLGEILLLAEDNPHLLAVYSRYGAAHLVAVARRLRTESQLPSPVAERLLLRRDEYGWLTLHVAFASDSEGGVELTDAEEFPFAEAHALRISFEPSDDYRQPMLGELFDIIFKCFGRRRQSAGDKLLAEPGEFDDSESYYAEERHNEAHDSERYEILAEMESDRDGQERTQDSGWHDD